MVLFSLNSVIIKKGCCYFSKPLNLSVFTFLHTYVTHCVHHTKQAIFQGVGQFFKKGGFLKKEG